MSTLNVSLPDDLKGFIDQQVTSRGYDDGGAYVRDLVRREQDREKLRAMLLEGAASGPGGVMDEAYFEGLRERIRDHAAAAPGGSGRRV